jgi:FeS assembly SUF system protein
MTAPEKADAAANVSAADPPAAAKPESPTADVRELEQKVIDAIRTVYDPEVPVNIYEMGLIYGIQVNPDGEVRIQMTLTAPACPSAQTLPAMVHQAVESLPEVNCAFVEIVWDPPWTPARMSDAAKLQLGMMY